MLIDPSTRPRRGETRAMAVDCSCGSRLTTIEGGLRLLSKAEAHEATDVRELKCGNCGKRRALRLRED